MSGLLPSVLKAAATYSPALPGSTIGAAAAVCLWESNLAPRSELCPPGYGQKANSRLFFFHRSLTARLPPQTPPSAPESGETFGILVQVGFAVAGFTPPAYLRRSLRRPCEVSSRRRLRA